MDPKMKAEHDSNKAKKAAASRPAATAPATRAGE
jgi:hypothetical protein